MNNITYRDVQEESWLRLIDSMPVSVDVYERYIRYYKDIIALMGEHDVAYAPVNNLYEIYCYKLQPKTSDYNKISINTFKKWLKDGEKDNIWGIFIFNKHWFIYLKNNAFKLYYDTNRSSVEPKRITNAMLCRCCLKTELLKPLVKVQEGFSLYVQHQKNIKEQDRLRNSNYYYDKINTVTEKIYFYIFTTADSVGMTKKIRNANRTAIMNYRATYEAYNRVKTNVAIVYISPYVLPKRTLDELELGDSFEIKQITTKVLKKYFNNLVI